MAPHRASTYPKLYGAGLTRDLSVKQTRQVA